METELQAGLELHENKREWLDNHPGSREVGSGVATDGETGRARGRRRALWSSPMPALH